MKRKGWKRREKREVRMIKSHWEIVNIVEGNEIAMGIEHAEDTNTGNQLNEDNVVIPDSLSCTEHESGFFMI